MKRSIFVAFIAITIAVELTGCKPKETTLTGQVFIVTQGAENVKLGDIEILLIEKSQAANFLRDKLPTIKSEISYRQKKHETAKEELQKASSDYDSFKTNGPATKPEYILMKDECDRLSQEYSLLSSNLNAQIKKLNEIDHRRKPQSFNESAGNVLDHLSAGKACDEILAKMSNNLVIANPLKVKINAIDASLVKTLAEALSRLNKANAMMIDYPTGDNYFADFPPSIIQRKLTDADGKFSFTYPRNSIFTIYAKAERMVGTKTEKYYWLVDAPNNLESAQIFLSNNNLVFIDPDGYFKIKPVNISQESKTNIP